MRMLLKQEVLGWVAEKNLNDMVQTVNLAKKIQRAIRNTFVPLNRVKRTSNWSCYNEMVGYR